MDSIYNEKFYNEMYENNYKTAVQMIPVFIEKFKPNSIVDVGCGRGIFLAEVKKYNENMEILGLDGDYVNKLLIDKKNFLACDISKKIRLNRKYDLAISLEVAEHISSEAADIFIENLTDLSDIIIFSAAIPEQGGDGHINEQWPSYWNEKFEKKGYYVSECLRNYFWKHKDMDPYRRQNVLLYIKKEKYEDIKSRFITDPINMLDVVHPEFYKDKLENVKFISNNFKRFRYELIKSFSYIDYNKATEQLSKLGFWKLLDEIDMIEDLMRNEIFSDKFKCFQLDEFSKNKNIEKYILWGAGEDGKNIEKILKYLKKEITMWCDNKQAGKMIEKRMIISPLEMLNNYNDEIIIIGSRKYQKEITDKIIDFNNKLKDSIFLYGLYDY